MYFVAINGTLILKLINIQGRKVTICPKCNYQRKESDINPEWECPSCGVAYIKAQNFNSEQPKTKSKLKPKTVEQDDITEYRSNKTQLLIVGFICLTVGFFGGREHIKYEVRSSMEGAFSSVKKGLSKDNEKGFFEQKASEIKAAFKPTHIVPFVSKKRFRKFDYEDNILLDISWDTSSLKKPTRAIKGVIIFSDLFGESKFEIRTTITDTLTPRVPYVEKGIGFKFNQFKSSHKWMLSTDLKDMKVTFDTEEIIYKDGSTESYD